MLDNNNPQTITEPYVNVRLKALQDLFNHVTIGGTHAAGIAFVERIVNEIHAPAIASQKEKELRDLIAKEQAERAEKMAKENGSLVGAEPEPPAASAQVSAA